MFVLIFYPFSNRIWNGNWLSLVYGLVLSCIIQEVFQVSYVYVLVRFLCQRGNHIAYKLRRISPCQLVQNTFLLNCLQKIWSFEWLKWYFAHLDFDNSTLVEIIVIICKSVRLCWIVFKQFWVWYVRLTFPNSYFVILDFIL